ncbi:MAG: hypothetical protein U0169_12160 [Polyangiaceae bacterium]
MITFEHVSGKFGTSILHNFSTPALGRSVSLLGTPGDGVRAALAFAAGEKRLASGVVHVFGGNPTNPTIRKGVAYVPDAPEVPQDLRVGELLDLAQETRGERRLAPLTGIHLGTAEARLGTFELASWTRRTVRSLTVDEVRSLLLVEAFTSTVVRALVVDEPRVHVVPSVAAVLARRMGELVAGGGAVLVGTASARDAVELTDAVAVVRGSRFFTSIRSTELFLSSPGADCQLHVVADDLPRLRAALAERLPESAVTSAPRSLVLHGDDPEPLVDALTEAVIATGIEIRELRQTLPTLPGAGGAAT